jgi:hypothetical protein
LINDFDLNGSTNDSHGLGNIFVFEKWNFIKETNSLPGVAVDFWYFFPTGNTSRKLGTDDSAFRITTEVSKAWKYFSLHFNPGYSWGQNNLEIGEINAALLLKPFKTIWPALEYNYLDKKNSGHAHDLVPGVIWKFKPSWSFKAGIPINLDTTFMDRDRVGFVCKLSKKW